MSQQSAIEWTDATWNPVTGCSHVSEGCRHCYAETLSLRFGWSKKPWTARNAAENVKLHPERLGQPLHWRGPRMIFVNSMSDLFHELVPTTFIARVWRIMAASPRHTFQVLTKRADRMSQLVPQLSKEHTAADGSGWPLQNVWLGVSCEDQRTADERIPLLVEAPAVVRFLSCEPLLGPIDLSPRGGRAFEELSRWYGPQGFDETRSQPARERLSWCFPEIGWVIVGGESGTGYRRMETDWARSLRDQCVRAGVPFFFKQWGGRTPKAGGRELDGRTWDEMPQLAGVPA